MLIIQLYFISSLALHAVGKPPHATFFHPLQDDPHIGNGYIINKPLSILPDRLIHWMLFPKHMKRGLIELISINLHPEI